MARGLLADGRSADVARMIGPLLAAESGAEDDVILRTLMARVRLLDEGRPLAALALLEPYARADTRARLPHSQRAEVALWLGWCRSWQHRATYDEALAVNLLDEAERHFGADHDAEGRCWTLLGKAHAYFGIDEYRLMVQALDEASTLQVKLGDTPAQVWLHHFHVIRARFQGRYDEAARHVDRLEALHTDSGDAFAHGLAQAHRAVLGVERGIAPDDVVAHALAAETVLTPKLATPGYPLVVACRARLTALLRAGRWDEALDVAPALIEAARDVPTAEAYVLPTCARIHMLRGEHDDAAHILDEVLGRLATHHRLLRADASLLRAEMLARRGAFEAAGREAETCYETARATGHRGYALRALLALARIATSGGDVAHAQALLQQTDAFSDYFGVLPLAARRFTTLGALAERQGRSAEACACYEQAAAATRLMGDVYGRALATMAQAPTRRRPASAPERAQLVHARTVLHDLGVDLADATTDALPGADDAVDERSEAPDRGPGAALARAAVSIDLVLAAWLAYVRRLLPQGWLALIEQDETGRIARVATDGTAPEALAAGRPASAWTDLEAEWLPLPCIQPVQLTMGVERVPGRQASDRLRDAFTQWAPVMGLAVEHALLRERRHGHDEDGSHQVEATLLLPGFIHASAAMQRLAQRIAYIRSSHSNVLVTGEPGAGKERVAQAIHATSTRSHRPFVAFSAAGMPHALVERQLFGGAERRGDGVRGGALRQAAGGTLFIDEVADLPPAVQTRLARHLDTNGVVFDAGDGTSARVRVVAASSLDVEAQARSGTLHAELFYRLNVLPLHVPPLRARRDEIPLFVHHFLDTLRPPGMPMVCITHDALEALVAYAWPGNVRQLRNEIERLLTRVAGEPAPVIDVADLNDDVRASQHAPAGGGDGLPFDQIFEPEHRLTDVLAGTERSVIVRVLREHDGQVSASATVLGLTRQGLYKKMKRLGIDPSAFQTTGASLPEPAAGTGLIQR